jgi:hypothetical protein
MDIADVKRRAFAMPLTNPSLSRRDPIGSSIANS